MIVTSTAGAYGALGPFITGLRTLGNNTPILNSWAGDGNYWLPKSPTVTNYYFVTYASVFGDDPNPAINKLAKQVKAGTGGFITGLGGDRRRRHGDQAGGRIDERRHARQPDGEVRKVPTLSGLVSFSPKLHTVFGRQYRVIKIQNNSHAWSARSSRRSSSRSRLASDSQIEAERRPGDTLRASSVSRAFDGRSGAARRHADVGRSEVVGLIGPNGAGKSTLVNVVSGFDRPDGGAVSSAPTMSRAGRRIAVVGTGSRARSSTAMRSGRSRCARTSRCRRSASARRPPRRARRADGLLDRLGLEAHADAPGRAR